MIKFFRRIRQKLLSENKFSKYLIYAIGEIFLVVIGILIALQINNWNESKKLVAKEKKVLAEIVDNLNTNEKILVDNINIESKRIAAIDSILTAIQKNERKDSMSIWTSMSTYKEQLSVSGSSYDNLKSIGLDIVKNDSVKKAISQLFDITYSLEKENIDLVGTELMSKLGDFVFSNPSFFETLLQGKISDMEALKKYQFILTARKQWKIDVVKGNKRILKDTEEVISKIEDYLKSY